MINGENYINFSKNNMFYIKNFNEGNNYPHICLYANYDDYNSFIKYIIKNCETSFVDFYFANLQSSQKQIFYNKGYENIIKNFNFVKDEIFYNLNCLDEQALNFLIKISFDELLFSTFYFKNPDAILWTNYCGKWVLFFKHIDDLKYFEQIIKNFNIKIKFKKELL